MKSNEIRKQFLEFFETKNHIKLPSSSLVPINDPTLLFVNAGMVQFKDFFTGKAKSSHSRVVTVQKCLRAGGKHNDLENVGYTARHHTFFEMLGNFSFGDYFKEEAIFWAWELLTKVFGIPEEKLYVTAHFSDQEAENIWLKKVKVDKDHFFFRGDKDNFWEMGEVGPCGPCSEIFFDHGPKYSNPDAVIKDCLLDDEQRYVEIWNLVFMQYERYREGDEIKQRGLPNPCIDTGSGLERIAAALQGVYNNYDTDVFSGIIVEIEKLTQQSYSLSENKTSMRVVADHIRSAVMLITDGVLPSSEGRGYVLRRIIRRAVRYLSALGTEEPILYKLVEKTFESFGDEYIENRRNKATAEKYLKIEEQSFRQTLHSGLTLLEAEIGRVKKRGKRQLSGEVAFKLYDTHGFPQDLTDLILRENEIQMDHQEFERLMEQQRLRSRHASGFGALDDNREEFYMIEEEYGPTQFLGYEQLQAKGKLLKSVELGEGDKALIFNQTPFYGESGGQAGDRGEIVDSKGRRYTVKDTIKPVAGLHAHIVQGNVSELKENDEFLLTVDSKLRSKTARNHTATHLLHSALRKILGDHVKQAGSYVGPERLRFDFSHPEGMTKDQLRKVERMVNEEVFRCADVFCEELTKEEALAKGAVALFGEKYGSRVRVISVDEFSVELCGGTHVRNTGDIGLISIVSESSLSAGVRRIEALTGRSALSRIEERMSYLEQIENLVNANGSQAVEMVSQLQMSLKSKDRELKSVRIKQQVESVGSLFESPDSVRDGMVLKVLNLEEGTDLKAVGDKFIERHKKGVVLISSPKGSRTSIFLKTYMGNSYLDCSKVLKRIVSEVGGSGGGKPDMAQGSVDSSKLDQVKKLICEELGMS